MGILQKKYELGRMEVAFIIIILLALVGAGFYAWKLGRDKQASINSFAECVAAGNPVMESYPEQCMANGQSWSNPDQVAPLAPEDAVQSLFISEWGITLTLNDKINDANYVLDTDSPNIIRLSTSTFDSAPRCVALRQETPGIQLGFTAITRALPDDELSVVVREDDMRTYAEAVDKHPDRFKRIGDYVYNIGHGNGESCAPEHTYIDEFREAFQTIEIAEQ